MRSSASEMAAAAGPKPTVEERPTRVFTRLGTRASGVAELQRARIITAAVEVACERRPATPPVAAIVAAAGVSRKTFYEFFEDREDCMREVFEHAIAMAADVMVPAYTREPRWAGAVRAALVALLGLLEDERELGSLTLEWLLEGNPRSERLRARVLTNLVTAIDEGRSHARASAELSALTAEVVVAGALALLDRRVRADVTPIVALTNELMSIIVLPYRGVSAAAREARRPLPRSAPRSGSETTRSALEGVEMRLTYRTAGVLSAVARRPGSNNLEISALCGIRDQGQISKLLARLAGLDLLENTGRGHEKGAPNAWHLTPRGRRLERACSRQFANIDLHKTRTRGHTDGRELPLA